MEAELETLLIYLKIDDSGLSKSTIEPMITRLVSDIKTLMAPIQELMTLRPRVDISEFGRGLGFVRSLTDKVMEGFQGLQSINIDVGIKGTQVTLDALGDIRKIAAEPSFGAFAAQMARIADVTKGIQANKQISVLASEMNDAYSKLVGVQSVPGLESFMMEMNFANLLAMTIRPTPGLRAFTASVATSYANVAAAVNNINPATLAKFTQFNQTMASFQTPTNANVPFANLSNSFLVLSNNLSTAAHNLKSIENILASTTGLNNFKLVTNNINTAAAAFTRLNAAMQRYTQLAGHVTPPVQPGRPGGFGGGAGGGGGSSGAFGFDPIRRSLGVLTSLGTSMVAGFLGFELSRQLAGMDEEMIHGMSVIQLHMRQQGQHLPEGFSMEGVRNTMQREILDLSRTVATGPRDLAAAFRELSVAGYGTAASIQALAVVEQFSFVNGMQASDAARHLTTMMRQLGMVSNDALENATNMRKIADLITAGVQVSDLSAEQFARGIQRITPHIRLMNRGLEDSVGLMAAFGRIDTTTAVTRAETLIRSIHDQFIRSQTYNGPMHSGGAAGRDPIGPHMRRFTPGMGVQPLHRPFDSVRIPNQAFASLGVTSEVVAQGVGSMIRQIDRATSSMTPLMRMQRIMALDLPRGAQEALVALLASTEAMEAFSLTTRNTDGVLRDLANTRLQSFNSQLAILRNNFIIFAGDIMRVFFPVLQGVNYLLIQAFDAWWAMDIAGRSFVVTILGIVLGLAALRFAVPFLIGLLRILLWDTMRMGALAAWSAVTMLGGAFMFFVRGIISTGSLVINVVSGIYTALKALVVFVYTGAIATLAFFKFSLGIAAVVQGIWSAGMAIATGVALAYGITIKSSALGTIGLAIAQAVAKVTTWLFAGALTGLGLTALFAWTCITLGIAIVVALIVVLVAAAGILAAVLSAILLVIFAVGAMVEFGGAVGWRAGWNSFIEGARDAFWITVAFFDNFRDNMDRIAVWMDNNWTVVVLNIGNTIDAVFRNIWHNIGLGFTRVIVGMISDVNGLVRDVNATLQGPGGRILLGLIAPGAALVGGRPPQIPEINLGAGMAAAARAQFRGLREGEVHQEIGGLELNMEISAETRQMLNNMFSMMRNREEAGELADAVSRVGYTFKEISLRRFVLEGSNSPEDMRREEIIIAEQQRSLLQRLVELAEGGNMPLVVGM